MVSLYYIPFIHPYTRADLIGTGVASPCGLLVNNVALNMGVQGQSPCLRMDRR